MASNHFDTAELSRFWEELLPRWGKEPHLFERPFSRPLASDEEYFGVVKSWAKQWVDEKKTGMDPLWIEDNLIPGADDASLEAFCSRVEAQYDDDWFLYVSDGVQRQDPVLWDRAVEIVAPAIERMGGLPPAGFTFDFFLGRYDRTPTGIHRDDADTFAFVTLGPKRMYFWPPEAFESPWSTADKTHCQTGIYRYEKHLDSAIAIEANAGDVIYWPRSYYHIGASPDKWCGMVTLGMWWFASPERVVRLMVEALLQGAGVPVRYPVDLDELGAAAASPPDVLRHAANSKKKILDKGWDRVVAEGWARFVTSYGFRQPPRRRESVERARRFRVRHPVAAVEVDGQYLIYACGWNVGATANRDLVEAVRGLSVGREFGIDELSGAAAADGEASKLLVGLQSAGALEALG